jgi:hypothetical protein
MQVIGVNSDISSKYQPSTYQSKSVNTLKLVCLVIFKDEKCEWGWFDWNNLHNLLFSRVIELMEQNFVLF